MRLSKDLKNDCAKWLSQFSIRVPDTLAHLMIGFDFLLAFLNAKEEIGVQDIENYKLSFKNIIVNSSVRNNSIVENENYSYQFCDKLKSLLDSGRCSVNVIGSDCDMNRKGFIGFEDDNYYYLIMNAAFSEVVKLSKEMGESFSIGKNSLIQQLVDDGIMVVNPCKRVTVPKGEKKEKDIYTLEEVAQLFQLLETAPLKYRTFFNLMIYSGFRRGEMLGLEWKDIDWEQCYQRPQNVTVYS